jgi:hypothetical protein
MSELDYITVRGFKSIASIEELKLGARQICEIALTRHFRHVAPRNPRTGR